MRLKFIQKSKFALSVLACSTFLLNSNLLESAPPVPDFDIEKIGEELMHPDRFAPIHSPVFNARRAQASADPLLSLKAKKEAVLGELKKIASVDESGYLRAGTKIQSGQEQRYIELIQQYGSLCIDGMYAEEIEKFKTEESSEQEKISSLLSKGGKYLTYLKSLSIDIQPAAPHYGQFFYPFDNNILVLISDPIKLRFSLTLLEQQKANEESTPLYHGEDPETRLAGKKLAKIYEILNAKNPAEAEHELDRLATWMLDFMDFTTKTEEELKALKMELRTLMRENGAFMERLDAFKKGERPEEVSAAMVPYFKYFGLIPTSTGFLKVDPAPIEAAESVIKENFVKRAQSLRADIERKQIDLDLYQRIKKYILEIQRYISRNGRIS